jgi:hypothetical protein
VATKKKPKTGGFRKWTEEDVTAYRAFYAVGTRQRLAVELVLNLGIRPESGMDSQVRNRAPWHVLRTPVTICCPPTPR